MNSGKDISNRARIPERWPFVVWVANGFGLGLSPIAPGTVGSIWGVIIAAAAFPEMKLWGDILLAVVLALLAIPVCDRAEKIMRKKDDRRIVADEYMTFPICLLGLPLRPEAWWIVVVAFVTNRIFDIWKPPPAYQAQSLKGGLGIVADDVIASLYSLAANHLIYFAVTRYILT